MLFSVDPGIVSGWALRDGKLLDYGEVDFTDVVTRDHYLLAKDFLESLRDDWRGVRFVAEDQWYLERRVCKRKGIQASTFKSVKALMENRCGWECAAAELGLAVEDPADPKVWMPAVSRGAPGYTAAERVLWVCQQGFPEICSPHEAAAVMIGVWKDRLDRAPGKGEQS